MLTLVPAVAEQCSFSCRRPADQLVDGGYHSALQQIAGVSRLTVKLYVGGIASFALYAVGAVRGGGLEYVGVVTATGIAVDERL